MITSLTIDGSTGFPTVQTALFTLLKPFKQMHEGVEIEVGGVEMRGITVPDLELLDQFKDAPIALLQHLIAALCCISVEQVQLLDMDDFTMLAEEAMWQLREACKAMDLVLEMLVPGLADEEKEWPPT